MEHEATAQRRHRLCWPFVLIPLVAGLLLAFYILSLQREPIPFGLFLHPPIYGYWRPVLANVGSVLGTAAVVVAVGALLIGVRRQQAILGLILVILSVALAASVAMVRDDKTLLTRGVSTSPESLFYTADIHLVAELGIRGFAREHPNLTDEFRSYASRTHPPGSHIVLYVLYEIFGDHPLRVSTVIAALGLAAAFAAWFTGLTVGNPMAGRLAGSLFLVAPGPLLLAYTSMDSFFATLLSVAGAILIFGLTRDSVRSTAIGAVVLAIGTLFTFATAFLALTATIAAFVIVPGPRRALQHLLAAAIGGAVTLLLASLTIGFDLIGSFSSLPDAGTSYDPYWIVGNAVALFTFVGLPISVFGLRGLLRKGTVRSGAVFVSILLVLLLIWGSLPAQLTDLRPGEVERTWAFIYPLLAGVAGVEIERWTRHAQISPVFGFAGLAALSIAQAVLIQSLWDTVF